MTHSDIVILGGGLAGLPFAIALSQRNFSVTVIEKNTLEDFIDPKFDGRTTALNAGSSHFLKSLDLWDEDLIEPCPICDVRTFEENSPWQMDFSSKDNNGKPLGYIALNMGLRKTLLNGFKNSENINLIEQTTVQKIHNTPSKTHITLDNGEIIETSLVIGCEGRFSPSRQQSSIKVKSWDYGKALVLHLAHDKPHNNTAWQVFTSSGPFALLPMNGTKEHPHMSGIVWSQDNNRPFNTYSDESLIKTFSDLFPYYGDFIIASKRWEFPLAGLKVDKVYDDRFVIVGDAAHALHPIAGQGINLGWRDVMVLSDHLKQSQDMGLDIGSDSVLEKYNTLRQKDVKELHIAMDSLYKLYLNKNPIIKVARQLGTGLFNQIKPLKKYAMKKAMGL